MMTYYHENLNTEHHEDHNMICIVLIILSICYLILRPLKEDYMSILEGLLYSTTSITALLISRHGFTKRQYNSIIGRYVIMLLIVLPSVVASALFIHRLALRTTTYKNFILFLKRYLRRKDSPQITEDDFPYNRMTSPNVYTPII